MPNRASCSHTEIARHCLAPQVKYCLKWDAEAAGKCKSLRRRYTDTSAKGKGKPVASPASPAAPTTPATLQTARPTQHMLVSTTELVKEAAAAAHREQAKRGPIPKKLCRNSEKRARGVCCLEKLGKCITKKPKRAQHKCLQCGGEGGAFYHERCFWSVHSCTGPIG